MSAPLRVLVLCTGNSARSQIAEALLSTRGAGRIVASSAGSHPAARVNPHAEAVLRANGIAWEGRVPRHVDSVAGERFDLVITVCDDARDACPVLPGAAAVHWGMPDPAAEADPDRAAAAFATTWRALSRRVDALLALPLEAMRGDALARAAAEIHASAAA